jgi:hypothetical protein
MIKTLKKHTKKDGEGGPGRRGGRADGWDGVWDVWDVVKKCLTFSKWECLGYSNYQTKVSSLFQLATKSV